MPTMTLDKTQQCTRRDFLRLSGATLAGTVISGVMTSRPLFTSASSRILVLVRLGGGNDGLNTVVPYTNDIYYRCRPTISIPKRDILPIDEELGLHSALSALKVLFDQKQLAIVQGVGTPRAFTSHARAVSAWQTGDDTGFGETPWIHRLSATFKADSEAELTEPGSSAFRATVATGDSFAARLHHVANAIASGDTACIYELTLPGFDTHAAQPAAHAKALRRYSSGIAAFQNELHRLQIAHRVVTLTYSEFGRRVEENPAAGTDHGLAGPVFVIGERVNGGLYGPHPSLDDLLDGNLRPSIDYRFMLGHVIDHWLQADSGKVLGQRYAADSLRGLFK